MLYEMNREIGQLNAKIEAIETQVAGNQVKSHQDVATYRYMIDGAVTVAQVIFKILVVVLAVKGVANMPEFK